MGLKKMLQEKFNVTAISAQVVPLSTYNQEGELITARQLVVLDAEDKYMFMISHVEADNYVDIEGYVIYEKIFQDYIFTEEQWKHFEIASEEENQALQASIEEEGKWEAMPADKEAVITK